MTSMARQMGRRAREKNGREYKVNERPYVFHDDGSYHVLHPTKGWRFISAARLRAQRKMARILA